MVMMKRQKLIYIIASPVLMLTLIFAFQNCTTKRDGPITTTSIGGSHAVFKLSEKYGGDGVSDILWQIKSGTSCGVSTVAVNTGLNLEISWDDSNLSSWGSWGLFNIATLIHLEQEGCFIYDRFHFGDVFSVDHLSCARPSGFIKSSLSSDSSVTGSAFPVGSIVNLEFETYTYEEDELEQDSSSEDISFQWSIKKVGDDIELADLSQTSPQITHTFSELGIYNISVRNASDGSYGWLGDDREIFIGLCEKEVDAVEVILSQESFGSSTPKKVLENQGPIFNYVRPSDPDNKVTITFHQSKRKSPKPIYKYKRDSSSQFIDIDIQNANACFFDSEPQKSCNETQHWCPEEEQDCNCFYEIRENLSPLPSCSGKAYDMSTLDRQTTECTVDVFVVAASNGYQEDKREFTFYNYCRAGQEYCEFGQLSYATPVPTCP